MKGKMHMNTQRRILVHRSTVEGALWGILCAVGAFLASQWLQ